MPCPAIEVDAFAPEIRTSLHLPLVEILDAEPCVFHDALDAGDVPESVSTKLQDFEYVINDVISSIAMVWRKLDVLFREGPGPKDTWLKYCGTAGKPGGKRRKQTSTCGIGRNRATRLNYHNSLQS